MKNVDTNYEGSRKDVNRMQSERHYNWRDL